MRKTHNPTPGLSGLTAATATLKTPAGETTCKVGAACGPWTVRAILKGLGLVVLEDARHLVYSGAQGEMCRLRKPWADDREPPAPREPQRSSMFFEALLAAGNDPLAEQVLAAGEPDFPRVAAMLPPLVDYGFVGDERTRERPMVDSLGRVEMEEAPPFDVRERGETPPWCGLLDGSLPVLCHLRPGAAGRQTLMTFAAPGEHGQTCVWRREVSVADGKESVSYLRSPGRPASPTDFYARLLSLREEHESFMAGGLDLRLPEPDLLAAAHGMLEFGRLTFLGLLSRYGVGTYATDPGNSFPPATIYLVQAYLAWGWLDRARESLNHYLHRYMKWDGSSEYYGPAVAEYGQILTLAAEYLRQSGDVEWLSLHLTILRPVWQRLIALRQATRDKYPPGDPRYGLIPGLPEADYHAMAGEWERFYYSGDVWACRGFREMGRALCESGPAGSEREGAALLAEAAAYHRDLLASLKQAMAKSGEFVPPGPDQTSPIPVMTGNRHASYCNYRYLLEMVSAGVLPVAVTRKLARWRREHGGEMLVMTRFEGTLDDWPALHYARALLEADDLDHYLLLMYAHWAHHSAEGNLASYEQVSVRPDEYGLRRVIAGQVLPCQVMVPTMLRWGLVYEERDRDVVWFCRAIPRRWLQRGAGLSVAGAPTRFGLVGLEIAVPRSDRLTVTLDLPRDGLAAAVKLRLRAPEGKRLTTVSHGKETLTLSKETVTLPAGLAGTVKLEATFGPARGV